MYDKKRLEERRAQLSQEQQALLRARLRGDMAQQPGANRIPRRAASGPAPLSFSQQRLWFLYQLDPGDPGYNESGLVRLEGPLDVAALERGLAEIVRRHEVLRTIFRTVDDQPVQIVQDAGPRSFAHVDLSDQPPEEQERTIQRLAEQDTLRPFDLGAELPWRYTLIRRAPEDHMILFTHHHIACDGWSMGIMQRELARLYEAFSTGRPAPLSPLPIQYADYSAWQRAWVGSPEMQAQLAYWKRQLEAPELLELPVDFPRASARSGGGALYASQLPAELARELRSFCQREGVTEFVAYLSVFKAMLFHYSRQRDILVGTPAANRQHPDLEGLIGFFLNTLALRTHFSPQLTFRDLLRSLRQTTLDAASNQDLPIEYLMAELQRERQLGEQSLIRVLFIWQNWQNIAQADVRSTFKLGGFVRNHTQRAKFDVSLTLEELPEGLTCSWEYRTDLFTPETIARLDRHFRALLASCMRHPERRIAELELETAEDRRLRAALNVTDVPAPAQCVHELVAAQAAATPAALALVAGARALTYRELDQRANQLAHALRERGVGPECLVGVALERDPDQIVSLLAILKAGAAYLPLDPDYPQERLALMLRDARPALVLTQQTLLGRLPLAADQALCLDRDWDALVAQQPWEAPPPLATPRGAAYVIYTSGSTGQPKGVVLEHLSLSNYAQAAARSFALGPGDRVLQFASISFDAAAEEIYPCLLAGATLVLRDDAMLGSSATFMERCGELGITLLDLPTAFWHQLAAELTELAWPPSVRLVIIGGERALPEAVAAWQERCGSHARLLNTYGPTEATIVATSHEVPPQVARHAAVPIGRPVANVQAYVLDSALRPAPTGVPGELYLGGLGLARGYLNQPGLTAERFVPDPFGPTSGGRLYRTGDLVRLRDDGALDFLGRVDQQVKVRGFRIEPEEIERTLLENPAVQQAVVLCLDLPGADQQLVAFLVPAAGVKLDISAVRVQLGQTLPLYMQPAYFIELEALPLNRHGKLDRAALRAAAPTLHAERNVYVAPRTPTEQRVAELWSTVLGIVEIGVHDNFFHLGGHSLLAIQTATQIRRAFNLEVSLRQLFENPTIAETAALLDQLAAEGAAGEKLLDLAAEAVLDEAIRPRGVPRQLAQPRQLLLTGATGFLGAYLLAALQQSGDATITCLVRAADEQQGWERLAANAARYGLALDRARIRVLPGDLSLPGLGLSDERFAALAAEIDAIYHNGALINQVYSYRMLKPANVTGTAEILRLACLADPIPLHYVSTVSVFTPYAQAGGRVMFERDLPALTTHFENGYEESKWVAEGLVRSAAERGLPVTIYRPGRVAGAASTGACNHDDMTYRMIKACVELGRVPDTAVLLEELVDLTPVDYVAGAIAALARRPAAHGGIYHLVNPAPASLGQIVDWIGALGYPLARVPYERWRAEMLDFARGSADADLRSSLGLFLEVLPEQPGAGALRFDCQAALEQLEGAAVACPPVDFALLDTYFAYLTRQGILPPAPAH